MKKICRFLAKGIMAAAEKIFTFFFHILKGLYTMYQRCKFRLGF
jgi:hypothetical protein